MISTRQLAYRYTDGPSIAFDDLDVVQGGVLLLKGASGSGKSTWLALAAGLLAPSSGDITVAGQSASQLKPADSDVWRAKTIGFLPQKLHLSAALKVFDNLALAYWAAGQKTNAQDINQALAQLNVDDLQQRKPSQLSGGQAQRVALARAVLLKPKVILADEPTASLDDEACHDAVSLLCGTAERLKATLVIATHDVRVQQHLEAISRPFSGVKLASRSMDICANRY